MKQILRSKMIFDGEQPPFKGYIVINEGIIEKVENNWNYSDLLNENTELIAYDDQFVMPAIHDNHVFFSGYLAMNAGIDLSDTSSANEAVERIKAVMNHKKADEPIYAHGWDAALWKTDPSEELLNEINHFGPITAIDKNRSHCWMNAIAKQTYGFTEKETSAESRVLLIKEMLANKKLLAEVYAEFEALLLSKGVISMKEIVFDDAEFLSNIPQRKMLSNLYVQAVQEPLQHELLYEYKEKVFPEKVRFGGVKIMVDGVVADRSGDIYGVYQSGVASPEIDYEAIKAEVAAFNEVEIPCCLTTEGDKAGYKAASILVEFGKRLPEGVFNSISDLEMVTQKTAEKMNEGQVVAEVYPQILGLNQTLEEAYMSTVIKNESSPQSCVKVQPHQKHNVLRCEPNCHAFLSEERGQEQ